MQNSDGWAGALMSTRATQSTQPRLTPLIGREDFREQTWIHALPDRPSDFHPLVSTLTDAWALAAEVADCGISLVPDRSSQPDDKRTYRDLYDASHDAALRFIDVGVQKGERVLIVLPTSFDFVVMFFGVLLAGGVPVPSYPPGSIRSEGPLDRLVHILAHTDIRFCVTNERVQPVLNELSPRFPKLHTLLTSELCQKTGEGTLLVQNQASDIAFIQYTSGSTSRPKGVVLTHENLIANMHTIGQVSKINAQDVTVSWLPMYHDMGLIGTLLFSIYWRIPLVLMSPMAFLARPSKWLWAIHRHRGTLSPAPNFAYDLCVARTREREREGLDLSSWRVAYNGAQPVNYRTVLEFQKVFGPHGFPATTLLPSYGLAESSLSVALASPGEPVRHELVDRASLAQGSVKQGAGRSALAVVSVGRAMPGHEIAVVNEEGQPVPERTVGYITVRGPSVMRGYDADLEATAQVLREGWLWTGDLGYLSNGNLFVSGREKDLLILRGRNLYAEDLERIAERVEGVQQAVAFGLVDDVQEEEVAVIIAECRTSDLHLRAQLKQDIAERLLDFTGLRTERVELVPAGTLPRTTSGKKQRALTRRKYVDGTLLRS